MTVGLQVEAPRSQTPLDAQPFHRWIFQDGTVWTAFYRVGDSFLLRFPELADFRLAEDYAQAWPVPGVSSVTVQHLFLNQVLPLALSKRGKLVLHGSAVEIAGKSVAFIGESGRGKSTLAACFATSGFRFLTDDGLQLEWSHGDCLVMPSHPSIRLWEDSQEALIGEGVTTAAPVQFTSKARFLAGRDVAYCEQARPLHRTYFLGEDSGETIRFERLSPATALIGLVKNSFLLDIEARDVLALHFDALSRLATLSMHFLLHYPRRYDALSQVRAAIIRHATEESGST